MNNKKNCKVCGVYSGKRNTCKNCKDRFPPYPAGEGAEPFNRKKVYEKDINKK